MVSEGDLLGRAARALSMEADTPPAPVTATRARVLHRVQEVDRRRHRRRAALVVGWALFLGGPLAMATVGQPLARQLWQGVVQRYAPTSHLRPGAARPARPPLLSARAPSPGSHIVALPPVARPVPVESRPATAHAGSARLSRSVPPLRDPSLVSFQRAQRLHFHARDFGRAVAAWDDFLARHPSAPLALEARYNRALCLVRLGRHAEAAAALAPFANGTFTHYRQAEARALLGTLPSP